jgi:cell wall-associated NlpC family hydrolase
MNQNLWKVLTPSLVIAVCLSSCQTLQTAARTGRAELPVEEVHRVPEPARVAVVPATPRPKAAVKPRPKPVARPDAPATTKPVAKAKAKPRPKPTAGAVSSKPVAKATDKSLSASAAKPKPTTPAKPVAKTGPAVKPVDKPTASAKPKPEPGAGKALSTVRRTVVDEAESYLGAPYRSGGLTRQGVDCSGLVVSVFREAGIEPPRVSGDQARFGEAVSRQHLRSGDVLFFSSSRPGVIGHSAIVTRVTEDGSVTFIHATPSRGVRYDTLDMPHWASHYICARRYLTPALVSADQRK